MDMTRRLSPASLLLLGTTMAAAQTNDPENAEVIDEVIVRSSPLQSAISEIVLGTTVMDRTDTLRELDGTIGETLNRQPGVNSTFFGPGASRPIIRGLGADRIRILSNDISTFDVSTASQDHLVATEMANSESVEILRGAATLRYGQNAIGGVVNVFDNRIPRRRPEDGFDGDATVAYSSVNNGYTIGAAADASLNDNVVFHFDVNDRDADEYEIPGFANEEAEEEGVEGIVENSQSEATSATAGLSWVGDKGYLGFSVGRQQGEYGLPGGKKKEEEEEEGEETLLEEEEEETPITIDFAQVRFDLDGEYNFDSGLLKLAKIRAGFSDYEHTEFAGDEPETTYLNDEWELRAETFLKDFNAGAGEITGTFGFAAGDRDFEADGEEAFIPLNKQFKWGLWGLGRYSINSFIFEGSLRYDSQENKTDNLAFAGETYNETRDSYSAALSGIWEFVQGTSVGLNVARSERAPTPEELFSNGFHAATSTVEIGDVNLDNEVAYSVELSLKSGAGRFGFGANVYFVDYRDFIFLSPTGDFFEEGDPFPADEGIPVFAYQQADAELYGFELEADYLAVDSENWMVSLDGIIDYARGETVEPTSFGGIDNVNEEFTPLGTGASEVPPGPLPFFPPARFLGGVNMEYRPWSTNLRLEVQYAAEQDRVPEAPEGSEVDIPGTVPIDSYTLLNLYLNWRPGNSENVTLSLRGRNLTDEFARSATSFLAQSAPLPGRDIRLGVNVRF